MLAVALSALLKILLVLARVYHWQGSQAGLGFLSRLLHVVWVARAFRLGAITSCPNDCSVLVGTGLASFKRTVKRGILSFQNMERQPFDYFVFGRRVSCLS